MPVLKIKQDGVWKEIAGSASVGGSGGSVELDTTLTQEGMAADAKAVGDAIDALDTIIAVDENSDGNVELGDFLVPTISYNDLTDRPCGITFGDTITWEDRMSNNLVYNYSYYKVSDSIPTIDDCAKGFEIDLDTTLESLLEPNDEFSVVENDDGYLEILYTFVSNNEETITTSTISIIKFININAANTLNIEPGTYFNRNSDCTVNSLTITDYGKFETVINTLHEKYLPDNFVKLWENASPTSNFANGTVITIDDMDKYDLFGIYAKFSSSSVATNIFWGRIDTRVEGLFSSTGQKIAVRMFDISNAGITCNAGYYDGSTSASHVLPLEIFGIKGVK